MDTPKRGEPGYCLGDMHGSSWGFIKGCITQNHQPSGCEARGVLREVEQVLNYCIVETEHGAAIIRKMIDDRFSVHNKMIYIVGYSPMGEVVAAYTYDARTFGMATIKLRQTPAEDS